MSRSHRNRPVPALAALVVLCLASAACARKPPPPDGGPQTYGEETTTTGDGGDAQNPDGGGQPGGGGQGGAPSTTAKGGTTSTTRKGSTGGNGGNGAPSTTSPPSTDPAYASATGGTGAFARTVLRPQPAAKVVLEVMHQQGAAPTQRTVTHAVNVLRDVTKKDVQLVGSHLIPTADANVSEQEIESRSDVHAKAKQGNGQAVLRLLFMKGAYNGDEAVLGIAVRGDTAAVFPDQIRAASSPVAPYAAVEDAVTVHELGHLLGLVDIVLNTGRDDPEHPNHSTNQQSVMYWAVESDLVSQVLGGPPPIEFDAADLADLAAIRNGA